MRDAKRAAARRAPAGVRGRGGAGGGGAGRAGGGTGEGVDVKPPEESDDSQDSREPEKGEGVRAEGGWRQLRRGDMEERQGDEWEGKRTGEMKAEEMVEDENGMSVE